MFFDPYNGSPLLNFWQQAQMHNALQDGLAERRVVEAAARALAARSVAAQIEYDASLPLDVTSEQPPSDN